jgi:hypothetical protein
MPRTMRSPTHFSTPRPGGRAVRLRVEDGEAWAGTCRQLQLKLDDGTSHYANVQFTK